MKNFLLMIFSVFFVLVILEVGLRIFYTPLITGWGWNNSPRRKLSNFKNDLPNQLGVRGQKINYSDSDFVIVLLGDSQVEAATSSPKEMPEILLENYLNSNQNKNIKVFSLAAAGWGQDQQLLALKNYFKHFRANLILLWATPENDFWENVFPDRSVCKQAGHLKPTFRLIDNNLSEVYYKDNCYYKNSALLHLIIKAWQAVNGKTIEQMILDDWLKSLPPAHSVSTIRIPANSIEIDKDFFSKNVFNFADKNNITILTYEDFIDSRSHFTPYIINKSKRDLYSIELTKKLFQTIINLSVEHKAKILVFYPLREDFNIIYKHSIKFVKSYQNSQFVFPVKFNYLSLLKKIIPQKILLYFELQGENNICVGEKDRHLNSFGNKEVMEMLTTYIIKKQFIPNTLNRTL